MAHRISMAGNGYPAAALFGVLFVAVFIPVPVLLGDGAVWLSPTADLSQNLGGHLAFQEDAWRWPLLLTRNLMWPDGVSIAMTDSNPLVSVVAKVVAGMLGRPVNLLGLWLAIGWVLQPMAAVYAVRSLGARSHAAMIAAALIALAVPALLIRTVHINLCAHFLLLFGLGLSLRLLPAGQARWWQAIALSLVTIFLHPFLFLLLAILFAAPVMASVLHRSGIGTALAGYAASVALPVAAFVVLAGAPGGAEYGFSVFSMNLASPFWPQMSGLFGADLPIIDATGGQYEGYNYLGAGVILLLLVGAGALYLSPVRTVGWRILAGHGVVLAALTAIAVTHKVYLGHWPVIVLHSLPLETLMGPMRSSGRAFWPVGYMLALAPIALLEQRLPRAWLAGVLGLAVVLQWIDAAPVREHFRTYLAGGDSPSELVKLPPRATLLATATHCGPLGEAGIHVDRLRLAAVRAGLNLSDVRLSRSPPGMTCQRMTSDVLELALRPGEVRGFVGDVAKATLRSELLGPGVACRESRDMMLCGAADIMEGGQARIGAAVPPLAPGQVVQGMALTPFLGWGWVGDERGVLWSTGPRAVLVFRMPEMPASTFRLRLRLEGVGRRAGEANRVQVAVGANTWPVGEPASVSAALADFAASSIDLEIPPDVGPGGIVRVVIAIPAPVDQRVRGIPMPVRWAGVRLVGLAAVP
jgi:hypothetical protein